jgi:hypothetical protein
MLSKGITTFNKSSISARVISVLIIFTSCDNRSRPCSHAHCLA